MEMMWFTVCTCIKSTWRPGKAVSVWSQGGVLVTKQLRSSIRALHPYVTYPTIETLDIQGWMMVDTTLHMLSHCLLRELSTVCRAPLGQTSGRLHMAPCIFFFFLASSDLYSFAGFNLYSSADINHHKCKYCEFQVEWTETWRMSLPNRMRRQDGRLREWWGWMELQGWVVGEGPCSSLLLYYSLLTLRSQMWPDHSSKMWA